MSFNISKKGVNNLDEGFLDLILFSPLFPFHAQEETILKDWIFLLT